MIYELSSQSIFERDKADLWFAKRDEHVYHTVLHRSFMLLNTKIIVNSNNPFIFVYTSWCYAECYVDILYLRLALQTNLNYAEADFWCSFIIGRINNTVFKAQKNPPVFEQYVVFNTTCIEIVTLFSPRSRSIIKMHLTMLFFSLRNKLYIYFITRSISDDFRY